jgi:hypothetical protein
MKIASNAMSLAQRESTARSVWERRKASVHLAKMARKMLCTSPMATNTESVNIVKMIGMLQDLLVIERVSLAVASVTWDISEKIVEVLIMEHVVHVGRSLRIAITLPMAIFATIVPLRVIRTSSKLMVKVTVPLVFVRHVLLIALPANTDSTVVAQMLATVSPVL